MEQLEAINVACFTERLQEVLKPYQQEQNLRQKKLIFCKPALNALKKMIFSN